MTVDLVQHHHNIPGCLIKLLLYFVAKKIQKIIGFDLRQLKPIKTIRNIDIPTMYVVGLNDILSWPKRVLDLYNT